MPDFTVSQDIDDFMQSADDAAARTELGLGSAATSNTTDFAAASHTHGTGDITGLSTAISTNTDVAANTVARHTHTNKAILDATTASFLITDESKLDNVTITQPVNLDTLELDSHTHTNKAILDATSASFTSALETKVNNSLEASNIDTLSELNAIITDANLDDSSASRTPTAHTHPLTDLTQSGATDGQVAAWNNTAGQWQAVTPATSAVDSVNSQTGVVVLDADDIDDTATVNKFATAAQLANADSALQQADIDTLAELNAILTDANLDDSSASRTPTAHTHPLTDLTQGGATDGQIVEWNNTAGEWQATSKEAFVSIACSDETTDLATGVVATFRLPQAMTLTELRASVTTAPVGSNIIVDVKEGGVSIMTTNLLNIDNGDKTSVGSATSPNITDTALADDAEITVEITQIGSTTAGAGLKISLIGTKA